jgi:hypothetical protein
MKNIQVIDGAQNDTNGIYAISDKLFSLIFPKGTDVIFVADIKKKFGRQGDRRFRSLWKRQVNKKSINGIHGTWHTDGSPVDPKYFPTRRESEVINRAPFPKGFEL